MDNYNYIGIDIGSTNTKIGICNKHFQVVELSVIPNPMVLDAEQLPVYDVKSLWENIQDNILRILGENTVSSIGITGMTEPGVLVDLNNKEPLCQMVPWYDRRSQEYSTPFDPLDSERFYQTGLHNNYKYSIYKLKAVKNQLKTIPSGCAWLQIVPYIAYCLTGQLAIDPTLALRTYAYNLNSGNYDHRILRNLGLDEIVLPPVYKSGFPIGFFQTPTIETQIPVVIGGHDHLCAAIAAGAWKEDSVFASLGTTGILLGCFPSRPLTEEDYFTGYSYGLHVLPEMMAWQGGIQALGTSIDWCGNILGLGKNYEALNALIQETKDQIGQIMYYPYLNGSSPPKQDPSVRGAFLGLSSNSSPADIIRAVIEGISYELYSLTELIPNRDSLSQLYVVGGCVHNKGLMQVLADVLNMEILVPACEQAALTGVCMLAACQGNFSSSQNKLQNPEIKHYYHPRINFHQKYTEVYEKRFKPGKTLIMQW